MVGLYKGERVIDFFEGTQVDLLDKAGFKVGADEGFFLGTEDGKFVGLYNGELVRGFIDGLGDVFCDGLGTLDGLAEGFLLAKKGLFDGKELVDFFKEGIIVGTLVGVAV
jgi:hypothetical protein